jgi:hypothetical protein
MGHNDETGTARKSNAGFYSLPAAKNIDRIAPL